MAFPELLDRLPDQLFHNSTHAGYAIVKDYLTKEAGVKLYTPKTLDVERVDEKGFEIRLDNHSVHPRAVLLAECSRTPFGLDEVFIDGDEGLERDFGLRIPVVVIDGREEFEFVVDPERLRRLLSS